MANFVKCVNGIAIRLKEAKSLSVRDTYGSIYRWNEMMSEICFKILQKAKCARGERNKMNKIFINFEAG